MSASHRRLPALEIVGEMMERIREKMKGSGETMTIAGEMMETPGATIESAGEKETIAGEMIFAKHQIKLIIRMIALAGLI